VGGNALRGDGNALRGDGNALRGDGHALPKNGRSSASERLPLGLAPEGARPRSQAAAASRARSESRTDTSFETPGSSMVTP
jgi:hypothetical protein